ncbi:hypothetical protein V8C37DRAFT_392565 [Trichoderma ceciliae]
MESYLTNTIRSHGYCFYTCSRIGLLRLSSSTLFCAQAKTPSAKDRVESNQICSHEMDKKKRAISREVARYIATLEKANKEANFRREVAQLNATPKLRFRGNIIIQSEKKRALATAMEISKSYADRQHRVFFVDGSSITKSKGKPGSPALDNTLTADLGAAVVYKSFEGDQSWQERYFSPSNGGGSALAELAAIADGLAIATAEIMLSRGQNSVGPGRMATKFKVTILTDSTNALGRIRKLQKSVASEARLRDDPIARRIITRSQYLARAGVQLELRWVPGHSQVEGHALADSAARYAAKNQDIGVLLDEGLRLMEMEVAKLDGT